MILYLFDFDGTITKKDSFVEFIIFSSGKPAFYLGLFLYFPLFVFWKCHLITTEKIKTWFFNYFFKGKHKTDLIQLGKSFYDARLKNMVKPEAIKTIQKIKTENNTICVVSASLDIWLIPFCKEWKIDLLCTKLGYDDSEVFTGHFATPNCKGIEKKRRIKENYDIKKFEKIVAYGDNMNIDKHMFELSDEYFYKVF